MRTAVQSGARRRAAQRPAPRSRDVATIRRRLRFNARTRSWLSHTSPSQERTEIPETSLRRCPLQADLTRLYISVASIHSNPPYDTSLSTDLQFRLTTSISP